ISYSGRLKYLLNCHSVSVIHKREWIENYHHLLVAEGPHQNYVQVERNFSDLSEKIESLLDDPLRVELIANNSIATFRDRYLTPAAQACYWRRLFWAWRSVSFEPQLFKKLEVTDPSSGVTKIKTEWRGEPYQTYVMAAVRDLAKPPQPTKRYEDSDRIRYKPPRLFSLNNCQWDYRLDDEKSFFTVGTHSKTSRQPNSGVA
ncbi:MAG: hypothetical protein Q9165_001862, partial [Trypethelium subeluteriae]